MDQTLDLADVISFNDYPGWYDATVNDIPAVWSHYAEWARITHPGKPILISEVGASGLVGFRSPEQHKWSEDLQATIIEASIIAAYAAGFAGIVLWQLTDSRVDTTLFFEDNPRTSPFDNVSDSDWVEHVAKLYETTVSPFGMHLPLRPRSLNNKGLVALDRRHRKAAFWSASAAFHRSCPSALAESVHAQAVVTPSWDSTATLHVVDGLGRDGLCSGCILSVHTWNVADRSDGEAGVRVHAHALRARASYWRLEAGGLLRLIVHADARATMVGAFLSVAGTCDTLSCQVFVREAPNALWVREPLDVDVFLLRVAFGPLCGSYLTIHAHPVGEERDEDSVYAAVHMDRGKASMFRMYGDLA